MRPLRTTLLALTAVAILLPSAASAQEETRRTISVVGEASLIARNDTARVTFAVRARGRTRQAAVGRSSRRLRRVIGVLGAAGISNADLRTGSVSVRRRKNRRGRSLPGYEARQSVGALVRDARAVGRIVRAGVGAGGVPVQGPTFFLSDPKALGRRALVAALRDAQAKAGELAREAGLFLGQPISIRESGFEPESFERQSAGGLLEPLSAPRAAPPPTRVGRTRVFGTVFVVFEAS